MQTQYVRSFPEGGRNCYTLDGMNQGDKYLIKAYFLYGNYDGKDSTWGSDQHIRFDLYLGINFWQTITIDMTDTLYVAEIVTVALANYFWVCLVNTSSGVPFISALELRPIDNNNVFKDVDQSVSLVFPARCNLGALTDVVIRYPDDKYDRTWTPCNVVGLELMETSSPVQQKEGDPYDVPLKVMQTAGASTDDTLTYYLDAPNVGIVHPTNYVYMHFAELLSLNSTESRSFQVSLDGQSGSYNCSPSYLLATHIPFKYVVRTVEERRYLDFTRSTGSTLPPMFNAIEVYTAITLPNLPTYQGDVAAMEEIKKLYQIKQWQGDPCGPTNFIWTGINCTIADSGPPRVTSLNLSSHGFTGEIPAALARLTATQELDLSYNRLTGTVPEFLSGMLSLRFLDLSWNNLSGPIPAALLERQKSGTLILRLEHNSHLCYPWDPCGKQQQQQQQQTEKKNKLNIILVASIVPGVVIPVLVAIWLIRRARRQQPAPPCPDLPGGSRHGVTPSVGKSNPSEIRRFSYLEVKAITNNFERVIGEGGFGIVYHGVLEDNTTEVAVKLRSDASEQGTKEFNAETHLLSTARHRNLLSLVGYCEEENHLALIYPYMANGSLKDHLFDGHGKLLSWAQRLQIATEAARGLQFLHTECETRIIHRDVKTHNILLTEDFEAKISDFGMSKPFPIDTTKSFIEASRVVGTDGFLDPEYLDNGQLHEKNDVYSFGVVLLELITGVPAVERDGRGHIVEWVGKEFDNHKTTSIVDAKLQGEYDPQSVQDVLKLAMRCTMRSHSQRPTMSEVVIELKKSLEREVAREDGKNEISRVISETSQSDSIEMVRIQMGRMSFPTAR
ncbi:LRR receptor-like serine/threonine-protein kinase IOS1 isoform X1 [Typha angustifolia]|uniref:LRR receptor-like serine/threonine-protein kinase IOS1 isoform X1 n=1 Tax=Typha angustifolia TaxID=59011 RepID=UPI003C2C5B51